MKTVVYINNDKIKILQTTMQKKRSKKEKALEFTLEPGSVINGVLIRRDELVGILKENRQLLDKAVVLLNSSNIQVKKLAYPKMSKGQFRKYLKTEFSIPQDGTVVYGTRSIQGKNKNSSLFVSLSTEMMESYMGLFKEANLRIGAIEVYQNGLDKTVKSLSALREKTFIVNLLEGNNLLAVLFDQGEYVLTDRSRLLAEPGTEEFLEELRGKLSTMIQFNQSQKNQNVVTGSYYIGLRAVEIDALKGKEEKGSGALEIRDFAGIVGLEGDLAPYFCNAMGLLEHKKDIQLQKSFANRFKGTRKNNLGSLAIVAALVVALGAFAFVKTENLNLERANSTMGDKISSSADGEALQDLLAKKSRLLEIPVILDELALAQNRGSLRSTLQSSKLTRIMKEANKSVTITSLEGDALTKTLTIKGQGTNEFSSSTFISNLKKTSLFSKVEYSGYMSNAEDEYTFEVVCLLN